MNKSLVRILLASLLILTAGWQGWQEVKAQGADWLPVKYVRIEGEFQYIAKEKVKSVLLEHVINGFYNVDIQRVQASVKSLPWVDTVRVGRVWPDAFNIVINEQAPVVRWSNDALLNADGEIFKPEQIKDFSHLPLLEGPVGYEQKMLEILNALLIDLSEQGMLLSKFKINERRAWNIKLQNKMELKAGRNQPLKKIQRFLKTIPLIGQEQIADIAVVDLRYSNGYALRWKQGAAEIDWKKIAEMNKT